MIKIAELHRILESAARKGLAGEDADAKAAFQAICLLLAEYQDLSVDEFCLKARDGLQKQKAKKSAAAPALQPAPTAQPAPAPQPAPIALPGENAIMRYLSELQQTKTNSRQFETVVERMKKDKALRVGEAREIAKRFTGSSQTYKSKPEAAKAILQRQMTDIRAAGKAEHIADIF